MLAARYIHTATMLQNGMVLLAGGDDGVTGPLASCELYDPNSNAFLPAASMNNAREFHTATLLPNGFVLVAGGAGTSGLLSSAELYDPANDVWTLTSQSLTTARRIHTANALPDGRVLVAGGYNAGSSAVGTGELYDPIADTWTVSASPMATARTLHASATLPDGRVLLAGGFNGSAVLTQAEIYDPIMDQFTAVAPLNTARQGTPASMLPTGNVLLAGGFTGSTATATAEFYNPSSNTWTPTSAPMSTPRFHNAVALLSNGKVMVVGGSNPTVEQKSADLYDTGVAATKSIVVIQGDNQVSPVGTMVPIPVIVRVVFQGGTDVGPGTPVAFSIGTGGGSINFGNSVTGFTGIAAAGVWTFGTVPGPQSVQAMADGLPAGVIDGTAIAGPASQVIISTGNDQSAPVNTAVPLALSVTVEDPYGNLMPNDPVLFAVASGGGSVVGGNSATASNGVAFLTSWTLGTTVGANTLSVTAFAPTAPPTATFTATATLGTQIMVTATTGNNQSATVNTNVAAAPVAQVTDQFGNPVPSGTPVTFSVVSGGGSITGGSTTTDINGFATLGSWKLGTVAGSNTLSVTTGGAPPATITATAVAGAPASITISAGNNQSAVVNTMVAVAPSVQVFDSFGNPVSTGTPVTFGVASGGGSVVGGAAATNASGVAALGSWTLGTLAGTNTLSVTSGAAPAATFTATGVAGGAASITITAGNNQSAMVNSAVAIAPSVQVTDSFGNAVSSGTPVTFAVATGGGSVTGGATTTDPSGAATIVSWTLGTLAGTNTLSVTSGTAPSATITATAVAGATATITVSAGNNQSAPVNSNVAVAPSVQVSDSFGNPVSAGTPVTFGVATGGGSVTGGAATTNASGIATLGSWTLGTVAGTNTLSVTSGAAPAATVTATGTVGAPASITINAGNNQTATVNSAVAIAPSVQVSDSLGNPAAAGTLVTFTVATGGGTVSGGAATTNASGIATLGSWTLGTLAGTNTLSVTCGAAPAATFTATALSGGAASITINAGNNQSAQVNTNVAIAPSVLVSDSFGNAVAAGTPVTFAVASGGGTITGGATTTNASGIATLGNWTLGAVAGTNTLSVTSGAAPAATVTATAVVGGPASITISAGNNQTATVNATVAIAPSVRVSDSLGNPVAAGTSVTFAVATGAGTVAGGAATTNASGIATLGSWKLGTQAGTNTLSVTSGTAPAATITATGVAGPAALITITNGNNQVSPVNSAVEVGPSVQVSDAFGNAVGAGISVTFTVATGGGSIVGGAASTDTSGIAMLGGWALGSVAGTQSLSVTTTGAPSVTINATALPGAAAAITVTAGNNQSAAPGAAVAVAPSVLVSDQYGNPVEATLPVTFAVATGGGSVTGGSTMTDATGHASVGSWTLGATAGANTLSVTCGAAPAATVSATAAPTTSTLVINGLSTNDNPVLLGNIVTYMLIASDPNSTTLTYSFDFGDGSAAVTGSFQQGTATNVTHLYLVDGNFTLNVTVSGSSAPVTQSVTQSVLGPASGAGGVQNVSVDVAPVVNPTNNLGVAVIASSGGVIELGIDISSLTRAAYNVSTDWSDNAGRSTTVTGITPVHKYIDHGVYVATTTVTNTTSNTMAGKARKTLVVSSKETGESSPHTRGGRVVNTVGDPPSTAITLRYFSGQFSFNHSTKDVVSLSAMIQLPSGLDLSAPHEFIIGIGNIVSHATVAATGAGKSTDATSVLRNLKVTYPRTARKQLTQGGELARMDVTFSATDLVDAGFDTEGIVKVAADTAKGNTVVRKIQVGLLIDGVPYESQLPVFYTVPVNSNMGHFLAH